MTDVQQLYYRVSQFLFHEARLLDERRWEEWNALFSEDGEYWAPATPDQPDPVNHVSLIYENDLLRKVRIARFASPNAPSLQPFPRTVHLVSNILIDAHDTSSGDVTATSRFLMAEYRRDTTRYYAGACRHDLVSRTDGFRIRLKRVDLVNCDGPHESSAVWF